MGTAGSNSRILGGVNIFLGGNGSLGWNGSVCRCLSTLPGTPVLGRSRFFGFGQSSVCSGGSGRGNPRVLGFPGLVRSFFCGTRVGFGSGLLGSGLTSVIWQNLRFSKPVPKHSS